MKKFLSALTAFCMGASMIASVMPVSAFTPLFDDANKAKADGFTWSITEEVIPEDDGYAEIDVFVDNDPGTGAYAFQMLINGKEFSEYGIEIEEIAKGTAYSMMDTFVPNVKIGYVGASSTTTTEPQFAKANTPVATFGIVVPDDMPEGKYELTFSKSEFKVGDANGKELSPTLASGYLIVGDPETATTAPTQGGNTDTPDVGDAYTWYIEENVKPASDGYAEVDVYVANDPGTDSYAFQMLINGKEFSEYGIEIEEIAKGSAYSEMDVFVPNVKNGYIGASTTTAKTAQVAKEGVAVLTYGIIVPDDMAAGTYKLSFAEFMAGDAAGKELSPTLKTGTLVVGGSSEPVEPPVADGFRWYITEEVKPEDDGYAEIDVFVADDPGTGAYAFQMLINGKEFSEYGIEIEEIAKGTAYSMMDTFVPNVKIGYVGASSTTTTDPQFAKANTPVATFGIVVPEDMPEGKYELTFAKSEFKVGDANGKELNPALVAGYLVIGESDDPVDPPVDPPVADGFKWYITEEVKPADDGYAEIDVFVADDPGTGAYAFQMLINGKEFSEYGIEIEEIAKGTAYSMMDTFVPNVKIGYVGASSTTTTDPQFAKANTPVATFGIVVPEDMPEGKYELTFAKSEFKVGDANGKELNPALVAGYLVIGESDDPVDPPVVDGFKWYITEEVKPADDGYAEIDVFVADDPGTGAYAFQMLINGKEFSEYGIEIEEIAKGTAYSMMDTFVPNVKIGYVGASSTTTTDPQFAKANTPVATFGIVVPDDMPAGKYELTFAKSEFKVGDANGKELNPALVAGYLVIGETDETTEPDTTEPDTTEPDTTPGDQKIDAEWIIGQVEAEAGETVKVPVTVKGDKDGINSYILDMAADKALKAGNAAAGAAYEALNFVSNADKLVFAGTNYTLDKNVVAADNAVVFTVEFTVPADAKAGTVYDLTFEGLELYNIEMAKLIPTTTDGWIKVKTPAPTEGSSEIDAEWIIGQVEVNAGEKAVVPVTVKGDVDGINSYILDMSQDAGPVYKGATAGDAYEGLDFIANEKNLIFAGTNSSLDKNIVAADGAVVFNVEFDVPADAAPGTVYNLKFEDLELYNIDMIKLIPTTTDGWIKVKKTEVTTEAAGEWIIGTAEVEAGATVTIPVTVKGDKNGINSYILDMLAKEVDGAAPTADDAAAGNAYEGLGFVFNKDALTFAGTNYTLKENVKLSKDGAVVFEVTFTVPADAAPGTVYDLTFEKLSVYDINMSELKPTQTPGWIKIKEPETTEPEPTVPDTTEPEPTVPDTTEPKPTEPDTTEPEPTEPDTTEPKPTEPDTTEPKPTEPDTTEPKPTEPDTTEPVKPGEPGEWIIGTAEVEAGATVTIPVTVKGDKNGINSYILDMLAKEVDGAAPTADDAAAGNAYEGLGFVFNKDTLTFAGTNYTLKENVKLSKDGAVVFEVTFTVPADAAPGTVYDLTFESLSVYDINMNALEPTQTPGWIKIKEPDTTEPKPTEPDTTEPKPTEPDTTEPEPTEPDTTEPKPTEPDTTEPKPTEPDTTEPKPTEPDTTEPKPTEPDTTEPDTTEPEPQPGSATWQVGTVEGAPGEEVKLNVTVSKDTGLNSYKFQLVADEGPTAVDAVAGDAYAGLAFQKPADLATLKFGATSVDVANVKAEDGAVVLTITFKIPEDAKDGTVYNVKFAEDVEAYDADMVALDITEVDGWIKVVTPENPVVGCEYEMTGTHQFYFSHDPRNFKAEDLVATLVRYDIYKDGTKSEAIPVTDLSVVKFDVEGWTNPKEVYDGQVLDENGFVKEGYFAYYTGNIPATITDEFGEKHEFKDTVTAYIAVKGDANLDGKANSLDSAAILVYAAAKGAGNEAYIYSAEDEMLDMFAYFLADVTGESEDRGKTDSLGNEGSALDSIDAANILVYAAKEGAGNNPKWHETLSVDTLPKYTAEIAAN